MADRESSNIRVAANGDVYLGLLADIVSLPADTDPRAALDAALVEIGYASEDGVSNSAGVEVQDINVWQKHTPARRIVTARSFAVGVTLVEWKQDNFAAAFGGGAWTETATGVWKYEPPADEDSLPEYAMVVDWQDGDHEHRLVIKKGTITDNVETQLVRNAAAVLPITLNALTPDDEDRPWYYVTNDEAVASSS